MALYLNPVIIYGLKHDGKEAEDGATSTVSAYYFFTEVINGN